MNPLDLVRGVVEIVLQYLSVLCLILAARLAIRITTDFILPPSRRLAGAWNTKTTKVFLEYHAICLFLSAFLLLTSLMPSRLSRVKADILAGLSYGSLLVYLLSENEELRRINGVGNVAYWKVQYTIIASIGLCSTAIASIIEVAAPEPIGSVIAKTGSIYAAGATGIFLVRGLFKQQFHSMRFLWVSEERLLGKAQSAIMFFSVLSVLGGLLPLAELRTCVSVVCMLGFYATYSALRFDPVEGTRMLPLNIDWEEPFPRIVTLTVGAFWFYATCLLATATNLAALSSKVKGWGMVAIPLNVLPGLTFLVVLHDRFPLRRPVDELFYNHLELWIRIFQTLYILLGIFPTSSALEGARLAMAAFATLQLCLTTIALPVRRQVVQRRGLRLYRRGSAVYFFSTLCSLEASLALYQVLKMNDTEHLHVKAFCRRFETELMGLSLWIALPQTST